VGEIVEVVGKDFEINIELGEKYEQLIVFKS
jgi:hypothetical protein